MPTNCLGRRLGRGFLLAAVVALAFWLRVVQVGESLWLDELHTAWVVADGAQQLAPRAAVGNQSPAYFALVWSLTKLAGASECCLRLPSVLAGVALVVSVYLVVARWTACSSAGLLAALLVAIDPNCVFYGQEARSYALVQLVGLLHVVLFGRLVWRPMAAKNVGTNGSHGTEGTGAGREAPFLRASRVSEELGFTSRLAWIATGVLLFYLHYTAILLVAAEVVYCGLSRFLVPGAAVHDGAADQQGATVGGSWRSILLCWVCASCLRCLTCAKSPSGGRTGRRLFPRDRCGASGRSAMCSPCTSICWRRWLS